MERDAVEGEAKSCMSTIAAAGLEETDATRGPTASQSYILILLTLSKHVINCASDRRSLYVRKENLRAKARRVRLPASH